MKVGDRKAQRGSVLVEIALVLPVLLLIVLGGIDLDLMVSAKSALNFVAGEAARCGAQVLGCSPSASAMNNASGLGLKASNVNVTSPPCGPPLLNPCTVTVTYLWKPISPFFKSATLSSTATAQP
jgi:Flp pilus assembly protein TadG